MVSLVGYLRPDLQRIGPRHNSLADQFLNKIELLTAWVFSFRMTDDLFSCVKARHVSKCGFRYDNLAACNGLAFRFQSVSQRRAYCKELCSVENTSYVKQRALAVSKADLKS